MKNLKTLLIPVGLIVLVVGIFAFTNPKGGDDDKKCKVKIVKIINGEKTVIDSTFDCDESMSLMSSIHCMGDSLHKMIKVMMIDGDSGEFDFNFNFEFDEDNENGMKMMKFKGEDGEEMEMSFDFNMEGENGVMKMKINGEEMEIKIDDIHKHMEKLHEDMDIIHNESGNVEIIIKSDEDGEEAHTIKIIKTIDEDGNVTMKKIVDGEEMEVDDDEMHKMHGGHKMMFIGDNGKMKGNHAMTIDVTVDSKDGEEMKHVVIITKMTSDDKSAKKISKKVNLNKKELSINKLKFSPNPNDGKFDLSFKLGKKQPVKIKIFDVQGKEVYSENVKNFDGKYTNKIDISDNGEGIYILQIVQGEKASTSKIVIK